MANTADAVGPSGDRADGDVRNEGRRDPRTRGDTADGLRRPGECNAGAQSDGRRDRADGVVFVTDDTDLEPHRPNEK